MALKDAETVVIDKEKLIFTSVKLKEITYQFPVGRDIVCPSCKAINNIKIEPIKNNLKQAYCYCGNCGYKKLINVTYKDATVIDKITTGVI